MSVTSITCFEIAGHLSSLPSSPKETSLQENDCSSPLPFSPKEEDTQPGLFAKIWQCTSAFISQIEQVCEQDKSGEYWKRKIIFHFLNSPDLLSLSFIPADLSQKKAVYFLKKMNEGEVNISVLLQQPLNTPLTPKKVGYIAKVGFFLPGSEEAEQLEWKASSTAKMPQNVNHTVLHKDNLKNSLKGLRDDVKKCVEYFFKDSTTAMLLIRYNEGSDRYTGSWSKAT